MDHINRRPPLEIPTAGVWFACDPFWISLPMQISALRRLVVHEPCKFTLLGVSRSRAHGLRSFRKRPSGYEAWFLGCCECNYFFLGKRYECSYGGCHELNTMAHIGKTPSLWEQPYEIPSLLRIVKGSGSCRLFGSFFLWGRALCSQAQSVWRPTGRSSGVDPQFVT